MWPVFQDHHIISQQFENNPVIKVLGDLFKIQAPSNRLYLPSDRGLASDMGLTPHIGGPVDSYQKGIGTVLNELRSSQDFSLAQAGDAMSQRQLASDVYFLQDAMKAALINGDLYTNLPNTKSPDWVNRVNNEFFSNWRDYAAAHSDQIGRINAFERENGLSGQA